MTINYLIEQFSIKRDFIFDLDNTLIDEKNFLYNAYDEICSELFPNNYVDALLFLKSTFELEGRKFIFNKLLNKFPNNDLSIESCLSILRNYKPKRKIETKNWFKEFCFKINKPISLRIITNGNPKQQKNKIDSLKLPNLVTLDEVIYANEFEPKPNPSSFYKLKHANNLNSPIFIGDSEIDKSFCKNLRIEFFNIKNINNNPLKTFL